MKNYKSHIILMFFLAISFSTFAQTKFYVKANDVAYLDQSFAISFVLENGGNGRMNIPKEFPGFQLIGGPSTSSSYSNMNGAVSSSYTETYYFQATKEGVFTIPKVTVKVKGKVLETQELKVTVKKGQAPQKNSAQQNNSQQNRNFPQNNQNEEDYDWQKEVAKGIFIRMYADNKQPYVGQQINAYIKLYQRIQTAGLDLVEMPNYEGFWNHEFEITDEPWKQEQVNNIWYQTKVIAKVALFPQRAGEFSISPMKLQTVIQLRKNGNTGNPFYDQFFSSYENKVYNFQSNSLKIKAKALPLEGQPENFSGAVGSFKFTASIDSSKTETYKAFYLKTTLSGTGNIMMVGTPTITLDEDLEVFDPEEKEYISKRTSAINGTKKYDYAIVAHKPGEYIIPPLEFTYFDLATKKYKSTFSDTLRIYVEPSADYKEESMVAETDSTEQEIEFVEIKTENNLVAGDNDFNTSTAFNLLIGSPAFLGLLLFFIKKRKENYVPDLIAANRRKANKLALQKLKQAAVFLKANDQKAFYNEVIRSLWNYVSLKLNIDPEHLSKDNIKEKLLAQNVSEETANEYIAIIENCEMDLYSSIQTNQMQQDFDSAKELIIKLEDVL